MYNHGLSWQKPFINFMLSCYNYLGQEGKMPEAGVHYHGKQNIQRTQKVGKRGVLLPDNRESILSYAYL